MATILTALLICAAYSHSFLSRAVFVRLEWAEGSTPAVVEVEDRHVEDQHGVVPSLMATQYSSRLAQVTPRRSQRCLSLPEKLESSNVDFIVHWFYSSV
jgi:hypothetical protein